MQCDHRVAGIQGRVGGGFEEGNVHGLIEGTEVVPDEQNGKNCGKEEKQVTPESRVLKFVCKLGKHGCADSGRWISVRVPCIFMLYGHEGEFYTFCFWKDEDFWICEKSIAPSVVRLWKFYLSPECGLRTSLP